MGDISNIETNLTNVFGIELDSEFGDCPVLYPFQQHPSPCPLLFAAKCREWAQASYAKQVCFTAALSGADVM